MTPEQIQEYANCIKSPTYYAESNCKVFTVKQGYQPFRIFETQQKVIDAYDEHRYNIVMKYRQAGISTITALYVAHHVMFSASDTPKQVCIVAMDRTTAQQLYNKVVQFIEYAPDWMDIKFTQKNQSKFKLNNGSGVIALASKPDTLRSHTPTWLIMDEAAMMQWGHEIFVGALPTLSTGGRISIISTPKGMDPLYYKIYNESRKGENNFNIVEIYWWQDPRYIVNDQGEFDLVWEKDGEKRVEYDEAKKMELYSKGWKPTSSWYELQCRQLSNDKRLINQELNCKFEGSSATFIEQEDIIHQDIHYARPPELTEDEGRVYIWKDGDDDEKNAPYIYPDNPYIMGVDVAVGTAEDYSTITVLNARNGNQVMEYEGKIAPDKLAKIVDYYGRQYNNAMVVVDSGGGYGLTTLFELMNMEYPNVFRSEPRSKAIKRMFSMNVKGYTDVTELTPGLNTGSYRTEMLTEFKKYIANDVYKIRSKRLIDQLRVFVNKSDTRAEASKGSNDDLVFSFAIAAYVGQTFYQNQMKALEQSKAMLNAISMDTKPTLKLNDYNPTFKDPFAPTQQGHNRDYIENAWLFS